MYSSTMDGLKKISAAEGTIGLFRGWGPTLFGYSLQGMNKFGFYEIFKDVYAKAAGENAERFRVFGYALSSACAEVIADVFLCPFEATKVRVQTTIDTSFPSKFLPAFNKIKSEEGTNGLYKGIIPLWARQVPYTIVKFVFFEAIVEAFYKNVFTKPKETYSKATKLSITFASGYLAGILCAIVSHPADTMVSKLNNIKETSGSIGGDVGKIYSEIGFWGLWRGLGTRIFMIGTLTGLQWWIYDSYKTMVGLQTSGGIQKK
jgi:solute carrier family 25 phosphate transporter 3